MSNYEPPKAIVRKQEAKPTSNRPPWQDIVPELP
jgi:hypothetical protein